ncbi:MAG: hypothetical protein IJF69_02970 [Clostridia bacterium]|nr:hypothetical protein [Clostridia bacterium]
MKKILSVICILLTLSLLVSCKEGKNEDDYDHAADFTKEDGKIFEDVPDERYAGYTFRVLNAKVGSSASHMDTETIDGNNLNEALFRRNLNVEERLGIVIEEVYDTPEQVFDISHAACLSGEDTYSAICNTSDKMATMAVCGYLVTDIYLSGMDMDKPWWNVYAIDSAAVDSKRFFFYGDLQLSYYDAHSMVGVNMDMIEDIDGIQNPYTLVDTGKWTFDAMLSMMSMADVDLDGNGVRTYEDRYGTAIDKSSVLPLIVGCNSFISGRDEYGLPTMTCFGDGKLYDVFKMISDSLYERNDFVYDTVKNEADGMSAAAMFKSGYSLFYLTNVGALANLRDMDYEFAVLPMPKYSENQKNHVSFLSGKDASAIGVMMTCRNFKRASNIIENLAAESHRKGGLRECYIDTVLSFKYVNDEKSRKNLSVVISSGVFDPAEIYGWGGVCDRLTELVGNSDEYASTLASVRLKALSAISETVEEVNKQK